MPVTYTALATTTVGGGGASTIEFTSIPSSYTDLQILYCVRSDNSATNWNNMKLSFNGSAANGSWRFLAGYNGGFAVGSITGQVEVWINFNASSANTFSNSSVYISNYALSDNKNIFIDTAAEGNAADQVLGFVSGLWSNSSAISSISVTPSSGNFMQYSTATLYGIKSS